jgi:beta-phosphoglucomutase-like phosphatase (HAD superfamily)
MVIASGTDECAVRDEVAILGLSGYFGERVYGARDRDPSFDKGVVIDRVLRSEWMDGAALAVFGDGPVEIGAGRAVGALGIGVATDESGPTGRIDAEKARAVADAGARVIVPDYQPLAIVLAALFG